MKKFIFWLLLALGVFLVTGFIIISSRWLGVLLLALAFIIKKDLKLIQKVKKQDHKNQNLMKVYIKASFVYLILQELLCLFWLKFPSNYFEDFNFQQLPVYLVTPLISIFLIVISYLLFWFNDFTKRRSLFYMLCWLFLFCPSFIPQLFGGFSIVYTVWLFIMVSTVTGVVIFQDTVLLTLFDIPKENSKVIYEDLRFYLDKLLLAWLTLGSILAVCMTILWTAPEYAFSFSYGARTSISIYMVFCFVIVSILTFQFACLPLIKKMNELRLIKLS